MRPRSLPAAQQGINILPLQAFGSEEMCYQKEKSTNFAFIPSLGDGIEAEIHSAIALTALGVFKSCLQILVQYCVPFSLLWIALIWQRAL